MNGAFLGEVWSSVSQKHSSPRYACWPCVCNVQIQKGDVGTCLLFQLCHAQKSNMILASVLRVQQRFLPFAQTLVERGGGIQGGVRNVA